MSDRLAYGAGAALYDLFAGEAVYRVGRLAGVRMLDLRPGDTVLDVGCGTGLNFAYLEAAVGGSGRIIGLDRSAEMLSVARSRVTRRGWSNVTLVRADATDFSRSDVGAGVIDAVLSTYAMSVIDDAPAAWEHMHAVLRPGGRACIVDMAAPTGYARIFAPIARLACAIGGSDIEAHPWDLLAAQADTAQQSLRGGHIQVVAGTIA